MAAPRKKRAVEEQNEEFEVEKSDSDLEDDGDESGDSESENEFNDQEINVDFEAMSATDTDFHGIKKLLQQVFLKANINIGELTEAIICQNYVGSVLKQCGLSDEDEMDPDLDEEGDEDEVYGLISVINITEKKDLSCIKDIRQFLCNHCQKCTHQRFDQFYKVLEEKQVGYVISERFINIPAQMAPPMYQSLRKEMDAANSKKMKFDFDYYLLLSKTYQTRAENRSKAKEPDRFFINAEEELFYNASTLTFEYNVTAEKDTVVGGKWDDETEEFDLYRTVILVDKVKFDQCLTQIQEMYQ